MRRGISFKVMAAFLIYANLLPPALLLAETAKPAGVVAVLKGDVLITRVALPQQPVSLKFKDEVFFKDRITTKEQSLVRVLMGGKALITVRELSELTITEEPGKPSLVDLAKGKIGLAVARARMSPGESIEVRTPNAVAAVRGTVIVVEVEKVADSTGTGPDYRPVRTAFTGEAVPAATPSFVTNFHVLKGSIAVTSLGQPGASPVTVGVGLSVSVTGASIGQPRPSPPAQQLVKDLKADPQHKGTPEETTKAVGDKQQAQATALAEAIAPKPEEKGKAKEEPTEKAKEEKAKEEPKEVAKADATTTESAPPPSETTTTTTTADPVLTSASSGGAFTTDTTTTTTTTSTTPTTTTPTTTNVVLSTTGTTTTTTTTTTNTGNPPLVTIDGSTFTLGPDLASVTAGATTTTPTSQTITGLSGTTAMPLYSAVDGSDLAGAVSLSGGIKLINNTTVTAFSKNIFSVSGASATIGGTAVDLTTGSSITGTGIIVVSVGSGAGLEATSTAPLISVDNTPPATPLALFALLETYGTTTLGGPLFAASNDSTATATEFAIRVQGGTLTSSSSATLVSLTGNSSLTVGNDGLLDLRCCGSSASVAGNLLDAAGGGNLVVAQFGVVKIDSGTHFLADGSGKAMFNVSGTATTAETDSDASSLTVGTDRPIRGTGVCPTCPVKGALIDAASATVTTNQAVKIDTALLEASAPLVNLFILAASTMTSNSDFVKLVANAKMDIVPSDALLKLGNSTLNVTNGSLFNVEGGSFLKVTGNLVSLNNGSTLNITNGALVTIAGGSVFKLTGGSLGTFGIGTNALNITNSAALCGGCSITTGITNLIGVPVLLANGALASNVVVSSGFTPFTGLSGSNTVTVAGASGAVLALNGATSKVVLGP